MSVKNEKAHGIGFKNLDLDLPGLNQIINIDGKPTPALVADSPRNRIAFVLNALTDPLNYAFTGGILLLRPSITGVFDPTLSRGFIKDKDDTLCIVHEFSHGYAGLINAEFSEADPIKIAGSIVRQVFFKNDSEKEKYERRIVYACVDEGFAYWAQITYGLNSNQGSLQEEATKLRSRLLTGIEDGDIFSGELVTKQMEQTFDMLNFLNLVPKILRNASHDDLSYKIMKQSLMPRNILATSHNWHYAMYAGGYYFFQWMITLLTEQGLDQRMAADIVLLHPPTKISQLANPHEYAKDLSKSSKI